MPRPTPSTAIASDRRALLASEYGPAAPLGDGASCRVALVYPNSYHVGMSSLGFQIAWQVINATPGARAERFFLDTAAQGSIETGAPLTAFDVIAFSGAYEMDDPNVVAILAGAGLPPEARLRHGADGWPLVVMGGVLVSVNRRPLYPFVDLFCHGEAEGVLPGLLSEIAASRAEGRGRAALLEGLAALPGCEPTAGAYLAAGLTPPAPLEAAAERLREGAWLDPAHDGFELPGQPWALPEPPARCVAESLGGQPFGSRLLTPNTEFQGMALIDLARGCPHHCTFCWIGHNAPAYRVRPIEEILREVDVLEPHTRRFGLVASAVGAHPEIDPLCAELMRRGLKVSYSSLRVEEVSPTMLRALAAGGQKSVTIAPEAGAPRVRRLLGKRITDEQIFDVTEQIFGLGAESLKLYFMIGVPSETDDEALEIVAFAEKIRAIMLRWARGRGRIGSLGINLGIFVPKPNLPLNHIEPLAFEVVKKRLQRVMRALARIPNTRVNASSPDLARAQAILSMGGLEAARYVQLVRDCGGDWRAANRRWLRGGDPDAAWRFTRPRLSGAALRG